MGQPVRWQYAVVIEPTGESTTVALYRIQAGTPTRFLWLQTTYPSHLKTAELDAILQELYTAVVALMEITV